MCMECGHMYEHVCGCEYERTWICAWACVGAYVGACAGMDMYMNRCINTRADMRVSGHAHELRYQTRACNASPLEHMRVSPSPRGSPSKKMQRTGSSSAPRCASVTGWVRGAGRSDCAASLAQCSQRTPQTGVSMMGLTKRFCNENRDSRVNRRSRRRCPGRPSHTTLV